MTQDEKQNVWKAPYLPYGTLVNFIEKKLGGNPLPPRIDRGFLDNYAGSVQYMLLGTMQTIGLIGENGEIGLLETAAVSPAERKRVFRAWAEDFYGEQLELAKQNATAQMLHESFTKRGLTGSTMRKAVVFFLSLVDDVGLPKSPHFKAPRQGSGAAPRKRGGKGKDKDGDGDHTPPPPPPTGAGESTVVQLGEAGTVTVIVDVRWLALPDETFTALRKAIRDLETLGTAPAAPAPTPATDDDDIEDDDEDTDED